MRAWWIAALLVAPLLMAAPASALSCAPLSSQEPHSGFAGTVVERRGDAYLFAVREVWRGPDLQERAWIRFDRIWHDPVPAIGESWVVFADETFGANACTVRRDDEFVDDARPAKAREPVRATWWSAIRMSLVKAYVMLPGSSLSG